MLDGGVSFQTTHCTSGAQRPTTADSARPEARPLRNGAPLKEIRPRQELRARPSPCLASGLGITGALDESKDRLIGVRFPERQRSCCTRSVLVHHLLAEFELGFHLGGDALP